MNKLTNIVAGVMIPIIGLASGCMESFSGVSAAKWDPRYKTAQISQMNLISSPYEESFEKRAERLAQSNRLIDKEAAIEIYGEICHIEKMDKLIKGITEDTEINNNTVLRCAAIGIRYRERCMAAE